MGHNKSLLIARHLSIGHDRPLGRPLDIDLKEGDYLFVAGANGSGKTTLIKTLTEQIPALGGSIVVKAKLGYLPQQHQNHFTLPLTIAELCESYQIERQVNPLIHHIDAQLKWSELSGGMRQRILLALLLGQRPDILILDEPANHLDQAGVHELIEVIDTIIEKSLAKAIILVSHVPLNLRQQPTQVIHL